MVYFWENCGIIYEKNVGNSSENGGKFMGMSWYMYGKCVFLVENDGKLVEKCMAWLMVQLWKQIWDVFRQNMGQPSDDMGSFFFGLPKNHSSEGHGLNSHRIGELHRAGFLSCDSPKQKRLEKYTP